MSTATIKSEFRAAKVPNGAIVRRVVWKESRVLVGLWLAVAVLGVIIQWAIHILSAPAADEAALLLSAALAAAVLYAVGAAATVFSVEHEDETYGFLVVLPTTWWPLYAGKLAVAAVSAIALAGSLSVLGWVLSGFDTPGEGHFWVVIGLFGVAIIEALAWGTLCSLLLKRPLMAAILTLVTATAAVNLAVYLTSSSTGANLKPVAYAEAAPLRLAIVAVVLILSAFVARRWLAVGAAPDVATGYRTLRWPLRRARIARRSSAGEIAAQTPSRRPAMARLLWQTWRESWKLLPLPIGIAAALVGGMAAAIILTGPGDTVRNAAYVSTSLFLPALYGAMAFSADQRRKNYRFLAEHAARPRYVWLARQVVWLGTVIILSVATWLVLTSVAAFVVRFISERDLEYFVRWDNMPEIGIEALHQSTHVISVASLTWCGILTAYALGQFCSMVLRSDILAAFISLVLSVLICGWAAVLFAWQLSGAMFLLPVAAVLLFATWLRAPDWIAERNSWRAWLIPVLPVAAVLFVTAIALPDARLAQVDDAPAIKTQLYVRLDPSTIDVESFVAAHRAGATPEARETAAMYLRAVELLHSWEANDPLEPWRKPEFTNNASGGGGIDEAKIPLDQQAAFLKAKQRQLELIRDSRAAAVKLAMEASARPTCHFDFEAELIAVVPVKAGQQGGLYAYRLYEELNELLGALGNQSPVASFNELLAALRMSAHLRSGQPAVVFLDQFQREETIFQQIGTWAGSENRTNEELKTAIDQLTAHFRLAPWLTQALIADHMLITDVLRGRSPSLALGQNLESPLVHLAHLANQLPWERERALSALNNITRQNVSEADALASSMPTFEPRESGRNFAHHWLQPTYASGWTDRWLIAQPAAATSYLARLEYQTRVPVHEIYRAYFNSQTFQRAALLQFALAMYRRDHGDYPIRLSELVPRYLDQIPLDPFSDQQFVYRAAGLELPLRGAYKSNFRRIEANTPLFWSVGAGDARLQQQDTTVASESDENDPQGEMPVTTEAVYMLDSAVPLWWGEPAFAFTLPK